MTSANTTTGCYVHPGTRASLVRVLLGLLVLISACRQTSEETHRTPKSLFIIVDGISGDVIEDLKPPVLGEIAKQGGFTRAYVGGRKGTYSQTPTISAVGYNSLLTGTWVNKHNVWDNDIADPNYHYKDIFRIAEEYKPELKTAIFSTWTDNRTKLVGEGLPQTGGVKLDYKFDGLELDTVKYPHDKNADYIHRIDEAVADEAARYVREQGPDLSWVYLEYTDDMGHRYGDSEQFHNAIRTADQQIGRIWEAIKTREKDFDEDWLLVITTDHGRDSVSGKHHGGQSDRERATWIVTNAGELNARFKDTPGVVDIMPSICNHMGIPIPDDVKKELDGVPFIGPADFSDLRAERRDGKIVLTWKNLSGNRSDKANVFVTETNHFKEGGEDQYRKVGEVAVGDETFTFEGGNSSFYKILLEGPNHDLNVWLTE